MHPLRAPHVLCSHNSQQNLDVQYTVGIATGVPTVFISVGDNFQDGDLEGFLDIINFLNSESNPPHVLTTSYGQNENTISSSLAKSVALFQRNCTYSPSCSIANSATLTSNLVLAVPLLSSLPATAVLQDHRPAAARPSFPPSRPAVPCK